MTTFQEFHSKVRGFYCSLTVFQLFFYFGSGLHLQCMKMNEILEKMFLTHQHSHYMTE